MGPSNEYRPFYEFINLKGQFANIPREKVMKPTLVRIGHWHICIVITVMLGKIGTREFVISEAWLEQTMLMRYVSLVGMYMTKMVLSATAFVSMEIFNIASGQGYSPAEVSKDGEILK